MSCLKNKSPGLFTAALALSALLSVSCEQPETDILALVDQKVWEANAPRIQVSYEVDSDKGLTIPSVSSEAKQRLPFTVSYTPINQEWAFAQWTAYHDSTPLTSGDIYFENSSNTVTQVIILTDKYDRITLKPQLEERLRVWDWRPNGGTDTPLVKNTSIVVRFTQNIAGESFIIRNEQGRLQYDENYEPVYRAAGEFRNITILGSSYGNEPVNFARYFNDPVIQGDTLRLEPNPLDAIPSYSYITVILGQGINSSGTQVTLSAPFLFQYAVSNKFDDEGPHILFFGVSGDDGETLSFAAVGEEDAPVGDFTLHPGVPLYFMVSANDTISGMNIGQIRITEIAEGVSYPPQAHWYTGDYNDPLRQNLIKNAEKIYDSSGTNKLEGIHIFSYTPLARTETYDYTGPMELQVDVLDPQGNSTTRSYPVYRE
ncbi:putative lipoprotein [Treponema primitia ZAS-2]|uniref:Putative lipoprotein n=1 Tax=Treponema primitia (strain ATCC BAA-887 / DSM 12427 / ZAS-2) TaxID=545694 RepID=F5YLQ7_TREPZ|nr:hypothetical protein [Treponema primitia]AEF85139.1 putative lipoprotein [Treponema primitia ZAS-2]